MTIAAKWWLCVGIEPGQGLQRGLDAAFPGMAGFADGATPSVVMEDRAATKLGLAASRERVEGSSGKKDAFHPAAA
jgi:hypothetical protein